MVTLFELLRDGYFPRELPPPFTTAPFANLILSNSASLPASLEIKFKSNTSDHNGEIGVRSTLFTMILLKKWSRFPW